MSEQSSNLGVLTRELMATLVPDEISDVSQFLSEVGLKRTGAAMLLGSVFKKACSGDVSAAKLIREMNDEVEADESGLDYSKLSDAVLYKMLCREEIPPCFAFGEAGERSETDEVSAPQRFKPSPCL